MMMGFLASLSLFDSPPFSCSVDSFSYFYTHLLIYYIESRTGLESDETGFYENSDLYLFLGPNFPIQNVFWTQFAHIKSEWIKSAQRIFQDDYTFGESHTHIHTHTQTQLNHFNPAVFLSPLCVIALPIKMCVCVLCMCHWHNLHCTLRICV